MPKKALTVRVDDDVALLFETICGAQERTVNDVLAGLVQDFVNDADNRRLAQDHLTRILNIAREKSSR